MYDPLQTAIVVLSLVAAAATAVLVALNRRPTSWLLLGLAVLEVALLVQLVVGVAQVVGGSADVSALTFIGYLVGMLAIVPVATLWALGEPGRGGTSVLLVSTLVLPVLVLRLEQIWSAGG